MGTRRRIIKTELDRESRVTWRVAKALAADGDICCGVIEAQRVDGFKSRNIPSGRNLLLTGSSKLVLVAIAFLGFTVSCTFFHGSRLEGRKKVWKCCNDEARNISQGICYMN